MKLAIQQSDLTLYSERLAAVLRAHRWLIAGVLAYCLIAYSAARYYGTSDLLLVSYYAWGVPVTTAIYLFFFALIYVVYVMIAVRPDRLTAYITAEIGGKWLTVERIAGALVILLLLQLFFSIFTSLKSMIPYVNPFAWDPDLTAWDRTIHGGVDPWRLLQPVIGFPFATAVVNLLYQCWLAVMYGVLFWQAFCVRRQALRMQFFLSFILSWGLVGNLAATVLSSAGPVYFELATGLESPFAPLMAYLREANEIYPIWTLELQERLWTAYITDSEELGKGISAMPSMHVSTAVLFMLVAWNTNRKLGWAFAAYAGAVMIGSVHLAWHYALDGYVGAVMTYGLWRVAGWWVARDQVRSAPELARADT